MIAQFRPFRVLGSNVAENVLTVISESLADGGPETGEGRKKSEKDLANILRVTHNESHEESNIAGIQA